MSCFQTLVKGWINVNKQNVLCYSLWIVSHFEYHDDKHFDFQSELVWLHLWQCFMLSLLTVFYSSVYGFSLLFVWFVGYRHSLTYTVVKLLKICCKLNFMPLGIEYTCGQLYTHTQKRESSLNLNSSALERDQLPLLSPGSFLLLRSHCIFIPMKFQCKCKNNIITNFLFNFLKVV
jgi:hypothetical protein